MTTKRTKSKTTKTKKAPAAKTKKTVAKKATVKASAAKTATSKAAPKARKLSAHTVSLTDKARKVVRAGIAELVDRSLLEIAAQQYSKLLQQLARQRKNLDKDRQAALKVGERILERAKEVSASLVRK